MTETKASVSK